MLPTTLSESMRVIKQTTFCIGSLIRILRDHFRPLQQSQIYLMETLMQGRNRSWLYLFMIFTHIQGIRINSVSIQFSEFQKLTKLDQYRLGMFCRIMIEFLKLNGLIPTVELISPC